MARRFKRPTRHRSCTGKDKLTKKGARDRVRALKKQGAHTMQAYRCRFRCKHSDGQVAWHVGHGRVRKA